MQLNTYFIIFQEKTSKKFGPKSLSRPGPIPAWPIWLDRLPTWAPGPKTWAWAGNVPCPRRPAAARAGPTRASRWMQVPRRVSAQAGTKPALQPQPPNPSFISFPSPLSLSSPDSGVRRARWQWRRRHSGCRGGDGAAELCSPEVCVRPWPVHSSIEHRLSAP